MYKFYIGGVLLPVTPGSVTMTVDNKDETVDLINGGTYTVFNPPGLTDWEFGFRLPATRLPFAQYENGFKEPQYYINHLEKLKASREPFRFIIIRNSSRNSNDLNAYYDTNVEVSLSDLSVVEDAEEYGTGKFVNITLKQYKHYETGRCSISESESGTMVTINDVSRYWIVKGGTHISKQGETLRSIAFQYFGDEKYAEALAASQKPPLEFTLDPLPEFTVLVIDESTVKSNYEEITVTPAKPDIWSASTYTSAAVSTKLDSNDLDLYMTLIKNAASIKYKTSNSGGGFWGFLKKVGQTLATPITQLGSIDDIWKKKEELAPYNEQAPLVHFMFTLKDLLNRVKELSNTKKSTTVEELQKESTSVNQSYGNVANTIASLNSHIDQVDDQILESEGEDTYLITLKETLTDARDKLNAELKVLANEAYRLENQIYYAQINSYLPNEISADDSASINLQEALNRVKVDVLSASIHTTWVQEIGLLEVE